MLWGAAQDAALLRWYQHLCALRRARPALRRGVRHTLPVPDANVLAYRRLGAEGSLLVALNAAPAPAEVTLPAAESELVFATGPDCAAHRAGDDVRLTLPAWGGVALE
jgi:glycosidase